MVTINNNDRLFPIFIAPVFLQNFAIRLRPMKLNQMISTNTFHAVLVTFSVMNKDLLKEVRQLRKSGIGLIDNKWRFHDKECKWTEVQFPNGLEVTHLP